MTMTITPFFMFAGEAEEAMRFYVSVFDDAEIEILTLYPPDDPNNPGKVHHARFRLGQQGFQCIDSPVGTGFQLQCGHLNARNPG
jgi:predicted 3-demethylubiquinone-9 3-methyltransferase (glyoxalase superfamily)